MVTQTESGYAEHRWEPIEDHVQGRCFGNGGAWLIGIPRTAGTAHTRGPRGTCSAEVHSAGSSGKSVSGSDTINKSRSPRLDWRPLH